jgi:hypothetical protein
MFWRLRIIAVAHPIYRAVGSLKRAEHGVTNRGDRPAGVCSARRTSLTSGLVCR